jgi:hypothetical protein
MLGNGIATAILHERGRIQIGYWDQVLGNGIYVSTSIRGVTDEVQRTFLCTAMFAGCHTNEAISLIDKESTEESGKLVSNILRDQYYSDKVQVFPIQIMKDSRKHGCRRETRS